MLRTSLQRVLTLALHVAAGWWLAGRIGVLPAAALIAVVALALALAGVGLLQRSPVDRVTWRNHAAGWLLPFGAVFHTGALRSLVTSSASCSAVLGLIGAFGLGAPWLALAFLLDAVALAALLRSLRGHAPNSSGRAAVRRPLAVVIGLAAIGFGLDRAGWPLRGALVAGGPVLAVGLGYGAWVLFAVTVGRNARWN